MKHGISKNVPGYGASYSNNLLIHMIGILLGVCIIFFHCSMLGVKLSNYFCKQQCANHGLTYKPVYI